MKRSINKTIRIQHKHKHTHT